MNPVDSFLNNITMYRLARNGLLVLAAVAIICAGFNLLPFTALELVISLIVLLVSARIANAAFALLAKASPTSESAYITALILFFILSPAQSISTAFLLALVAVVAVLSKYLIAPQCRHIFNPAAFAVLLATLLGSGVAVWWIATPVLFPFALVVGLLIVRKLRRFDLFFTFFATAVIVFAIRSLISGSPLGTGLVQLLLSWPIIFFGAIMLTEPQTTPPAQADRFIYGVITGILFSISFTFGPLTATPEFALIVGNLYSYAMSFKRRITLTLKRSVPLTREIMEFLFEPDRKFAFTPGQYMEWTLPHKSPDKRGNRRFFTIASAPEDPFVRVAMRLPVEGSSFKAHMRALPAGAHASAANVAGEFTLPKNPHQKIAAIAGGIGITPFISMFRHLAEQDQFRDIALIYAASSPLDFAYKDEIDAIKERIGLQVLYLPTDFTELSPWTGKSGYLTGEILKEEVPDAADRFWYVSGPNAMVEAYTRLLRAMHLPRSKIRTDYFPGL